jgi:hypothetical protein
MSIKSRFRMSLAASALFLASITSAQSKIIYVDDGATGANDGTNWANAYVHLQDALADANAAETPVEIHVAQGLYKPDRGVVQTPGDREATFWLQDGLILRGGFAGRGEPDPNVRDVDLYKTTLSGDLAGNDVDVRDPEDLLSEPTRADNSDHVVSFSHNSVAVTLDGFTITAAHGDWLSFGGGLYAKPAEDAGGNITVRSCTFTRNVAGFGGGVYIGGGTPTLIDCTFSDNWTGLHISNCDVTLIKCVFSGNQGGENAGGVRIHGSNAVLVDCTLTNNAANELGGGMLIGSSRAMLSNCTFVHNSSGYIGGGFLSTHESKSTLVNCTFAGNSAIEGAGMYNRYGSTASLVNCTFAENVALRGAGFYNDKCCDSYGFWSSASLINCVSWGGDNEIGCEDESMPGIAITHSNVQGGWPGEGNMDADPLFADASSSDYHLKSQAGRYDPATEAWVQDDVTSPCIDAGDPNSPIAFEPLPNGGMINMGAYGGTVEASKSPSGLHAKYGGGTGELNDPHLIYTAEQLNVIGAEPNDWDKHFMLMADIDLSGYSYDSALIAPDADPCDLDFQGTSFKGILNGNGHKISNLTITGEHYLGLFGRLEYGAEIKNLRIIDVNIAGTDYVAGLVGFSKGNIVTSYCTGVVSGSRFVGGLTGRNWSAINASYNAATVTGHDDVGGLAAGNYGSIANSHNAGAISSFLDAGGLVGANNGSISTSYSTGTVGGDNRAGGLVGYNNWDYGVITSSFWDVETSGQSSSDGGTGRTTAEMQTAATFLEAGWDFVGETDNGTDDVWWILEGQDYPRLWWELTEED